MWNTDGKPETRLTSLGVNYINESVVDDEDIITANGPPAAKAFGERIVKVLNQ